jgi:hypothetical protein
MSFTEWAATVLIAFFYASVISIILLSYWKIHLSSLEIKEIKKILLDVQIALGQNGGSAERNHSR